ncbi:MAG: hypothetical protein J0H94_11885 [Rhizobiales bacterium]|nr:hypothetical protein [Hyphomicrobiales bacterium]
MKRNPFPYVKLRPRGDGTYRPRFEPGPLQRAAGFTAQDLKNADGTWFTLDQVATFATAKREEIRSGQAKGAGELAPAPKSVAKLLDAYLASADFKRLAPKTQADYEWKATAIRWKQIAEPGPEVTEGLSRRQAEFAKRAWRNDARKVRQPEPIAIAPASSLTPAIVKTFFEYLERERGLSMALGTIMVLSAAFSWARLAEGWEIKVNPCHDLDLPRPEPRVVTWTFDEVRAAIAAADQLGMPSIGDAILIGLFSGQRQGDILALVDKAGTNRTLAERVADGEPMRLVQSKTKARVAVFAAPDLIARLAAAEARRKARAEESGVTLVGDVAVVQNEKTGAAWTGDKFRRRFAEVRALAAKQVPSIAGRNFQDLRDTAVTWLARAECTLAEICSITGHSLQSATTIFKHYLELGEPFAREAIRKQVEWMEREGVKL